MEYVEIGALEAFGALVEKRMNKEDILCKEATGKGLAVLSCYHEELDAMLNKRLFVLREKEGK